jgi:predicted hydrocarbon binding protein
MSTVDIIKATHIITPQKTSKGNDYNKSNCGKYAGTAVGLGLGSHFLYSFNKMKKATDFFEAVNDVARNTIEGLSNKFDDLKITPEELETDVPKFMKKFVNRGAFVAAAVMVALGLGAGAIVDSITNHFLKKSADKKVQ